MSTRLQRVLLVDDDPATNFLHRLSIEECDCVDAVDEALSADAALKLLQPDDSGPNGASAPPELILLDINMPGHNGWHLLDALRQNPLARKPVISMVTTSANPDDRKRAQDYPEVDDFLTKPMSGADFRELLARHFPQDSAP